MQHSELFKETEELRRSSKYLLIHNDKKVISSFVKLPRFISKSISQKSISQIQRDVFGVQQIRSCQTESDVTQIHSEIANQSVNIKMPEIPKFILKKKKKVVKIETGLERLKKKQHQQKFELKLSLLHTKNTETLKMSLRLWEHVNGAPPKGIDRYSQ